MIKQINHSQMKLVEQAEAAIKAGDTAKALEHLEAIRVYNVYMGPALDKYELALLDLKHAVFGSNPNVAMLARNVTGGV